MHNKINQPKEPITDDKLDQAIYIHNAGLVIMGAFLNQYFSTLEMLEDGQFKDEETAIRAVHLLQYVANGHSETSEDLLVFNKIFCGLPIATPMPLGITLSEEEEKVTNMLMQAVLQNWEVMKNSSVENLRGSFLLRKGRLIEKDDYWLLHVDSAAFDITLSFLPWTLSMLNLSWMDKRIEVEWPIPS